MSSEFMELFGEWGTGADGKPKPLTVEPFIRQGASAPLYGAPISHPGLPQMPQERMVRSTDGNEHLSGTVVYAPGEIAADFPLLSRVTLADGRTSAVLSIGGGDALGLFDFIAVNLE